MKIYVHDRGVVLTGKAWEIKRKLKEYSQQHKFVKDWITAIHKADNSPNS